MTGITSLTIVTIPRNLIVLIGQISGIIVLVAIYTTEQGEIPRCGMAIRAFIPFSFVFATENRKIGLVVLGKFRCIPARVGRMANFAVGREIARFVVGAGGCLKICLVAGKTFGRRIHKIPANMTLGAIVDLMPAGQGEKQVIGAATRP